MIEFALLLFEFALLLFLSSVLLFSFLVVSYLEGGLQIYRFVIYLTTVPGHTYRRIRAYSLYLNLQLIRFGTNLSERTTQTVKSLHEQKRAAISWANRQWNVFRQDPDRYLVSLLTVFL